MKIRKHTIQIARDLGLLEVQVWPGTDQIFAIQPPYMTTILLNASSTEEDVRSKMLQVDMKFRGSER